MALTDMVIMPGADYQDACDAIREKDGSTAVIKSGDMGAKIRAIETGSPDALFLKNAPTSPPVLASNQKLYELSYCKDRFVATMAISATPQTDECAYSFDGAMWDKFIFPEAGNWRAFAYGAGTFVALKMSSAVAAYSTDGLVWTATTLSASKTWRYAVHGNGKFVAITTNTDAVAYSSDGVTWTLTSLPMPATWKRLVYGADKFVAISAAGDVVYSSDGETWNTAEMPDVGVSWENMAYCGGKFIAVSVQDDSIVMSYVAVSSDGVTWAVRGGLEGTGGEVCCGIAYGANLFIALSQNNSIAWRSADGESWESFDFPYGKWVGIAYGKERFVGVAQTTDAPCISSDGVTFSQMALRLVDANNVDVTADVLASLGV